MRIINALHRQTNTSLKEIIRMEKFVYNRPVNEGVTLVLKIDAELNRRLTKAATLAQRSKTKEATVRLSDHLANFEGIAFVGNRTSTK